MKERERKRGKHVNVACDRLFTGVQGTMAQLGAGAIGFIGPEDTCTHEAMIAAAQNLPMISYVSTPSLPLNILMQYRTTPPPTIQPIQHSTTTALSFFLP